MWEIKKEGKNVERKNEIDIKNKNEGKKVRRKQ